MKVRGTLTFLKADVGESTRNDGTVRIWRRASFLDGQLDPISFYYDDPALFEGIQQGTDVEVLLDLQRGRSSFFVNVVGVEAL